MWEPTKNPNNFLTLTPKELERVTFEAQTEYACMIFFGQKAREARPIFDFTPRGQRSLNFLQSKAIQFVPSLIVEGRVLLEGRMAIMRKSDYQLHGIPCEPIFGWFHSVAASFKAAVADRAVLLIQQKKGSGTIKEWRQVVVSKHAAKWRRNGRLLKQFPRGEVEFDIKLRSST